VSGTDQGRREASAEIPWHERPNVTVQVAALIIGVSSGKVYDLAGRGDLNLVTLAGRTLVTVHSLCRFVDSAVPHDPNNSRAAGAARRRMAAHADVARDAVLAGGR